MLPSSRSPSENKLSHWPGLVLGQAQVPQKEVEEEGFARAERADDRHKRDLAFRGALREHRFQQILAQSERVLRVVYLNDLQRARRRRERARVGRMAGSRDATV